MTKPMVKDLSFRDFKRYIISSGIGKRKIKDMMMSIVWHLYALERRAKIEKPIIFIRKKHMDKLIKKVEKDVKEHKVKKAKHDFKVLKKADKIQDKKVEKAKHMKKKMMPMKKGCK